MTVPAPAEEVPPSAPSPGKRPRADKDPGLTLGQKFAYGTGGCLDFTNMAMLQMLATPIFVAQLGVTPAFIGWIFFAQRIWDAVTDPLMGHISDNHRSRFGRRRVFMFFGGILTAIFFASIWFFPRGWDVAQYQIYFAITAFLFMTAHTVYTVPYQALGCEMTRNYHERTSIMSWRVSFGHLAFLYAIWVFYMVEFGKDRGTFLDTAEGIKWVVGVYAVLITVAAIVSSVKTKERFYHEAAAGGARIGAIQALRFTMSNRPFLLLIAASLMSNFAQVVVANLQALLNIFYVSQGSLFKGAFFSALFGSTIMLSSMASIPLFSALSRRLGKRNTLILCIALQMLGAALKWLLFNPDLPYLQIIVALLQGPGIAGSMVLVSSMTTDVVDTDELEHGQRREGMFVAIGSWVIKLAGALAVLIGGYLAVWIGYKAGAMQQDAHVMLMMKGLFAFVPAAGSLAAIVFILFYKLDEQRMSEIRALLDARHGR